MCWTLLILYIYFLLWYFLLLIISIVLYITLLLESRISLIKETHSIYCISHFIISFFFIIRSFLLYISIIIIRSSFRRYNLFLLYLPSQAMHLPFIIMITYIILIYIYTFLNTFFIRFIFFYLFIIVWWFRTWPLLWYICGSSRILIYIWELNSFWRIILKFNLLFLFKFILIKWLLRIL